MPIGPSGDIELKPESPLDPRLRKLGPSVNRDQPDLGPGARFLQNLKSVPDSLLDTIVNIPKGIAGIDPSADEEKEYSVGPSVNKLLQLGMAASDLKGASPLLKTAALPLAIPRKFHPEIINELKELSYSRGGLSQAYKDLLYKWTQGNAMYDRTRNLEMAEKFRNADPQDLEAIRSILANKLGTNTVPVFRGVREDEVAQIKDYFQRGEDPGIRSFSIEPKVSHNFADDSTRIPYGRPGSPDVITSFDTTHPAIRGMRMQSGQLYRADVPLENVMGYGAIPGQRELIIDLKGLNPEEQIKALRSNPSRSWPELVRGR